MVCGVDFCGCLCASTTNREFGTSKYLYSTRSLHRIFEDNNTIRAGARVAAWPHFLPQVIPSPGSWNGCLLGSGLALPLRPTTSVDHRTGEADASCTARHHLANPPTCHYNFTKAPAIHLRPSHRLLLRSPALELCGGVSSLSSRVAQGLAAAGHQRAGDYIASCVSLGSMVVPTL
jgi:hypothetical protein